LNSGPLEEQSVLLTTEPSLQLMAEASRGPTGSPRMFRIDAEFHLHERPHWRSQPKPMSKRQYHTESGHPGQGHEEDWHKTEEPEFV